MVCLFLMTLSTGSFRGKGIREKTPGDEEKGKGILPKVTAPDSKSGDLHHPQLSTTS